MSPATEIRVPGVLLGGPLCGQEFALADSAPAVTIWTMADGTSHAYERTASSEASTGRWIWRYLCKVGKKGVAS